MIVRDVTNTRPPDQLAEWLDGLGSFEQIEPAAAAERWGVSIRDAMERLHAMTGGPLEIPAGQIETYRRAEWTATASAPSRAKAPRIEEVRLHRLALVPKQGATREELMRLWSLSEEGTMKTIRWLIARDLLAFDRRAHGKKIWRRI